MKSIKQLYYNLPVSFRANFRSWIPKGVRRWYAHQRTDVFLISYPKCGRTWLRLLIGRAISNHFNLPEDEKILFLEWNTRPHPSLPHVTVVHDDRPMLRTPDELETSKEKYRHKKVIFLVRDPRDVIVSSYFEKKKRAELFGTNPYEDQEAGFDGELPQFIAQPRGGFDTLLRFYNIWAANRDVPSGFLLVRYEDLRTDPQRELRRVLEFIGISNISEDTLAEAVAYASFSNMRKMEQEGKFKTPILNPGNRNDQTSFKTRKGKIGGYKEYLSPEEVEQLNQKMADVLSNYFGYNPL